MSSRVRFRLMGIACVWYLATMGTTVKAFDWCYDICNAYTSCDTPCWAGWDDTCGGFGSCEVCGDGICGSDETCTSCPQDCGAYCGCYPDWHISNTNQIGSYDGCDGWWYTAFWATWHDNNGCQSDFQECYQQAWDQCSPGTCCAQFGCGGYVCNGTPIDSSGC
jgi:hypothetical protein